MRVWGMTTESWVQLSPEDRAELGGWLAGRNTPQKLVWRARIVLMWADGAGITKIVQATGKTKRTAYRWRDRYVERGIEGLRRDASRPGRKKPLDAATIERVVLSRFTRSRRRARIGRRASWHGRSPSPIPACSAFGQRMGLNLT